MWLFGGGPGHSMGRFIGGGEGHCGEVLGGVPVWEGFGGRGGRMGPMVFRSRGWGHTGRSVFITKGEGSNKQPLIFLLRSGV